MKIKHFYYKTHSGKKMHAVRMGQGKKHLFLIHGLVNNWKSWKEVARFDKKSKFTFIAIELLGFGNSERKDNYSLNSTSNEVLEFINFYAKKNKVASKDIYLGGLSMGSMVTAYVAAKTENFINGFILMAPVFKENNKSLGKKTMQCVMKAAQKNKFCGVTFDRITKLRLFSYLMGNINMFKFDRRKIDEYGYGARKMLDIRAFTDLGIEVADFDIASSLVKKPKGAKVLIIVGRQDPYAKAGKIKEGGYFIGCLKKDCRVVVVNKAGHPVSYEKPKPTFDAINNFVS